MEANLYERDSAEAALDRGHVPVQPSELRELTLLGDLNLAEFVRHTARLGGTVLEEDGLLAVAGSHSQPGPYRNCAIRLDNRLSAPEVFRRLRRFFGTRNRGYVLWVRDHADPDLREACETSGAELLEREGLPELYLKTRPELLTVPDDVNLRKVATAEERRDFVRVNADGWGMEGIALDVASSMFFHPDSVEAPNVAALIAYVDGKPASGAMAFVSHGVVGGYWGATAPWARRRGLADLCVRAMFHAGFDLGARRAVCQGSGSGEGIWRGMGFQSLTRYYRYLHRPATTSWE